MSRQVTSWTCKGGTIDFPRSGRRYPVDTPVSQLTSEDQVIECVAQAMYRVRQVTTMLLVVDVPHSLCYKFSSGLALAVDPTIS